MAKKKSNAGRPTVITEEAVQKLVEAFKNDFNDGEACLYANISESVYYDHKRTDNDFRIKIESAKAFVSFAAKRNIAQAIINKQSVDDAWKYLERRQKDVYSTKVTTTQENLNVDVNSLATQENNDDATTAIREALDKLTGKEDSSD